MKLLSRHIEALSLCADAAHGGDPWVSRVALATIRDLFVACLIRTHTPDETLTLKRHIVPTDEGYAALSKAWAPRRQARRRRAQMRGAA